MPDQREGLEWLVPEFEPTLRLGIILAICLYTAQGKLGNLSRGICRSRLFHSVSVMGVLDLRN
jgi:hypothetical protein